MSGTGSLRFSSAGLSRAAAPASAALAAAPRRRLLSGDAGDHLAAFVQLVDALHYHHIAGIKARYHFGLISLAGAGGYVAHGHGGIRLYQVYVLVVARDLHRTVGNQHHAVLLFHQQPHVDKLVGEQSVVLVRIDRPQAQRAGGLIDLIIDGSQHAYGEPLAHVAKRSGVAVPGFDRQLLAGAVAGQHDWQLILGYGEHDADRLNLGDDYQARGIRGMHDVAGVHQAQTDAPGDGRRDVAVDQVELGRIDLALVRLDHSLVLRHQRFLRGILLLGNGVLLQQPRVTAQV